MNQEHYGIEYWKNRDNLELKHEIMAQQFIDYFKLPLDATVLDYGCGAGQLVHSFRSMQVNANGFEPSKIAKEKAFGLSKGLIGDYFPNLKYDLITCIDVMEHLTLSEIGEVLELLSPYNCPIVFSICFEDDPNFDDDPTHITKRNKEWWKDVLEVYGWEVKDAPKDWIYDKQFLIVGKWTA